jgi:hypothetical protein
VTYCQVCTPPLEGCSAAKRGRIDVCSLAKRADSGVCPVATPTIRVDMMDSLQSLARQHVPTWLVLFPEGTRFDPKAKRRRPYTPTEFTRGPTVGVHNLAMFGGRSNPTAMAFLGVRNGRPNPTAIACLGARNVLVVQSGLLAPSAVVGLRLYV